MQITLTATEVADALAQNEPAEIMVFLATLSSSSEADELIDAAVGRHNGSAVHQTVAPWLRRLANALEAVKAEEDDRDVVGRVS